MKPAAFFVVVAVVVVAYLFFCLRFLLDSVIHTMFHFDIPTFGATTKSNCAVPNPLTFYYYFVIHTRFCFDIPTMGAKYNQQQVNVCRS